MVELETIKIQFDDTIYIPTEKEEFISEILNWVSRFDNMYPKDTGGSRD